MTSSALDLPPSVRIGPGSGGLTVVRVASSRGSAEVYLHGAQITSWVPAGADPVLWLSAASEFAAGSAIRGGVPICFPWFGPLAGVPSAPKHGFARLVDWTLDDVRADGDDVVLVLVLRDSALTRASAWPHRFEARYTITVGTHLTLSLDVANTGTATFTFEEALHTYLSVGDIGATEVRGLDGAPFADQLRDPQAQPGEAGPVRFTAETDRVYLATAAAATVVDGASARSVTIDKLGSRSTVVWNPWQAKAAAMADFGADEWTQMVCVETCNVKTDAVDLAPGSSHTMSVTLSIDQPLPHQPQNRAT